MPTNPRSPSSRTPAPRQKGGVGLFQLLGLGLLLMFVLFVLILVVRSLFGSA